MSQRSPEPPAAGCVCTRRRFLAVSCAAALCPALAGCRKTSTAQSEAEGEKEGVERRIRPAGPGAACVPLIHAAFVRRRGEYGMRWPGAIYDGEAARAAYTRRFEEAARQIRLRLALRPECIHADDEADAWLAQAKAEKADGLLVVLLDRQEHAWPTAAKAAGSGLPAVIFAPLGTAFTTNTAPLAGKPGLLICSTDDAERAVSGLRMLRTRAWLRALRYVVLQGNERRDGELPHFGTKLRYVPAREFLDEYLRTPFDAEVRAIAREYLRRASRMFLTSEQDVLNGVKGYVVARTILEREEGDGITMDCLGALGRSQVSLPCIAWSRMLDHGIPAACEADLGAALTHALVQDLLGRPGFQQDPVADTADGTLIGAHCSCPTRLNGFGAAPESFYLSCHHGKRDAVPRTIWREGQRVTIVDVELPGGKDASAPRMLLSAGTVVANVAVPPSGGCVVAVKVRLDGERDMTAYPGFHQLFVYGEHVKELSAFCRLHGLEARSV